MAEEPQRNVQVEEKTESDSMEALRMWSAVSFALIILGLGIPLWWKTTEVYRVPLPYADIEDLQHLEPRIAVNISLYTEFPSRTNKRMIDLKNSFMSSKVFDVMMSPAKLDIGQGTVAELEEIESKTPSTPGLLKIVETDKIQAGSIVLGNHRAIYFHPGVDSSFLVDVVKKVVLREDYLEDLVAVLELPGSRQGQERRLKSEPCFDVVFTTVNPEPDSVSLAFDSETSIAAVIDPLLSQLRAVADLRVKSQWLYFLDLGQEPKKSSDGKGSVITSDRIPHIISPLEKKLGSGVSSCPCLHFVLYMPRCSEAPMSFASPEGGLETNVVSPRWGGIQIINPSEENCVNKTEMVVDMNTVAKVFVNHLRYLLDLRHPGVSGVKLLVLKQTPLRFWELDSLYRARVLEQAISARLTLQSLSRLLGEISNIVINQEVGNAILTSIQSVFTTFSLLSRGDLSAALVAARRAYVTAETAFSHPSLLALLYFPDDQKYAVYIPLFLPVMIPVVLSLRNIWKWLKNRH